MGKRANRKDHVQSHRLALSPSFHFRGVLVTHCCQHPANKYDNFSDRRSVLAYLSIQHSKNGTMRTTSAAVFVSTFHIESVADVEQSSSPRIIETRREGACVSITVQKKPSSQQEILSTYMSCFHGDTNTLRS